MSKRVEIEEYTEEVIAENWVPKILLLGAVIGAATGLLGAYLLIQRSKNEATAPSLNAGQGVRLGVLVFGLLRQIQQLGQGD